jgi:K+-transporting ATPase KdpF subunit
MNDAVIAILIVPANEGTGSAVNDWYLAGGLLALLILGYLIYTLMKPEKF